MSDMRLDAALCRLEDRLGSKGVKIVPSTANPGPLGLYGFALTTCLLQGVFTGLTEANSSQMVYAFGFFFGGLAQFTAGLLEYQRQNAFATTAFCSFGAFWMAVAFHGTMKAAGIFAPIVAGEQMMLTLWGILTGLLWLCTFRSTMALSSLFFTLTLLFWFLAGGLKNAVLLKVAGSWGIFVSAIAFYCGTAALMEEVYGRPILPVFPLADVSYTVPKPTWPANALQGAYTAVRRLSPIKGYRSSDGEGHRRVDLEAVQTQL